MSHDDDLYDVAEAAATKARAVHRCPNHDEVLLTNANEEAEHTAYAIATNWAKEHGYNVKKMQEAVADVLRDAGDECPYAPCNPEAE
jgi:hypothetical protein